MKKILFVALISLLSKDIHAQSSPELADAIRLIDGWIEAQREYKKLPGITVGIVKDQQLIWSKGYGVADVKKNVSATPSTIFSICSISKLFTSVAIMQLYEAGKLRLDDSISAILPNFNLKQQFKDSGPITIRGLLTHSSGVPRESDFPYWTGPDYLFPTQQQVADKLGKQQMLYPASSYFQYSNLGMTLLGDVVEKISGKPYDVYVEENILKPLRLSNTRPHLPAAMWGNKMATGYGAIKRDGTRDALPLFDARGIKAAAGFSSTVEDLARFASWQFRLLTNGGKEILKSSTLKEMQRVHWMDPDWKTSWGLGFVVFQRDGKTIVGHGGACPGYRTNLSMDVTDKVAYIVMMNAGDGDPGRLARQISGIVLKAKKEKIAKSDNLEDYAGLYNAQPWGSETHVFPWYGKLAIVQFPSETPLDEMRFFKHIKDDTFQRIRDDGTLAEEITFEKNPLGKVVKMWQHSNYSVKVK